MKNPRDRIAYVDVAKAVGIVLMILGHCPIDKIPYLSISIYSFHMPLFFIAAGMFVNKLAVKDAYRKYFRRLIIPYCITCAMAFVIISLLSLYKQPIPGHWQYNFLVRFTYASGSFSAKYLNDIPIIGPLWFLWSMFWGCILWTWVSNNYDGLRKWVVIGGIALAGIMSAKVVQLPLCIQSATLAVIYLEIGHVVRKCNIMDFVLSNILKFAPFFLAFTVYRIVFGGKFCCGMMNLGSMVSFVYSIVAPIMIMAVALKFQIRDWFGVGRNTLVILCGHSIFQLCLMFFGRPKIMTNSSPFTVASVWFLCDLFISLCIGLVLIKMPYVRKWLVQKNG